MAAAAAAAVVGSGAGGLASDDLAKFRAEYDKPRQSMQIYSIQRQKLAENIMTTYDTDHSGGIEVAELKIVLRDYSQQAFNVDLQPSDLDVDFLFRLYHVTDPTKLNRREVLNAVDAWGEFIEHTSKIKKLFDQYDKDKSSSIDIAELSKLLNAIKPDDIVEVQSEVIEWIMEQADVLGMGCLIKIELARALCAYEIWLGRNPEFACPHLPKALTIGIQGRQDQPPPVTQSVCCILQ